MSERPLRSLLFAPGNEPRKVEKVATFGADAVILDLEDAVPDADKMATRDLVRNALPAVGSDGLVCVRIRSPRCARRAWSGWPGVRESLRIAIRAPVRGYV